MTATSFVSTVEGNRSSNSNSSNHNNGGVLIDSKSHRRRRRRRVAVDATLLRRALRLVHCLQRERGVTCSTWSLYQRCNNNNNSCNTSNSNKRTQGDESTGIAVDEAVNGILADTTTRSNSTASNSNKSSSSIRSSSSPSEDKYEQLRLMQADTDRAIAALKNYVKRTAKSSSSSSCSKRNSATSSTSSSSAISVLQLTLDKIRNLLQTSSSSAICDPPSCRRVLVTFNTFISAVLHESIFQITSSTTVAAAARNAATLQRIKQHSGLQQQADKRSSGGVAAAAASSSSASAASVGGMTRVYSHQALQDLMLQPQQQPERVRAAAAAGASIPDPVHSRRLLTKKHHRRPSRRAAKGRNLARTKETNGMEEDAGAAASEERQSPPKDTDDSVHYSSSSSSSSLEEHEQEETHLETLLHLLDLFVRLKESTGVERATLSAMLTNLHRMADHAGSSSASTASSSTDRTVFNQDDTSLLLNDVVLEIEQQRKQLEELTSMCNIVANTSSSTSTATMTPEEPCPVVSSSPTLPPEMTKTTTTTATSPLRPLIQELIQLSPELLHIQALVLNSCSESLPSSSRDNTGEKDCAHGPEKQRPHDVSALDALRHEYTAEQLWNLLSVYIDKLHSFELLIVEEIECCGDDDDDDDNDFDGWEGDADAHAAQAANSAGAAQSSLDNNNHSDTNTGMAIFALQQAFGCTELNELVAVIQGMSADQVKQHLLTTITEHQKRPGSSATTTVAVSNKKEAIPEANEPDQEDNAAQQAYHRQHDKNKMGIDDLLAELCKTPPIKEWEIDIYELRFIKRIGQGSAGTTYLADWSGQQVAVKVASITEIGLEGWRTEVQALQKLHHPNIIRLLGSVYHPHPLTFCLVLEYCTGGDLSTALCKATPRNFFWHVSISIAKGLQYLHSRDVIHRDIKPSNVLLQGTISDGNYQIRLTDFGVAANCSTLRDRTAETGTYRWMAPEVIRHEAYSQTADVYSYAVLMWQLLTREDPFCDKSQIAAAASVAMECARPPMPDQAPESITNLIQQLWDEDPSKRLSFFEIIESLTDLEQAVSTAERQWLDAPLGHSVYKKKHKVIERKDPPVGPRATKAPPAPHLTPPGTSVSNMKEEKNHPHQKRISIRHLFSRKSSHF